MFRIDDSSAATVMPTPEPVGPKPDAFFTKGDPGLGVPATKVKADWLNALQEEICYVIEQAGLALDKTDRTQLRTALQLMGALGYTHPQASPSGSWTVNHNMGSVNHHMTILVGGKPMQPDWDQSTIGANTDTYVFNEPVSGSAYVSL